MAPILFKSERFNCVDCDIMGRNFIHFCVDFGTNCWEKLYLITVNKREIIVYIVSQKI